MERREEVQPDPQPAADTASEKRPYEAPKVEAVRLSREAAESLT
jgi:hypothetical protein